MTVETVEDVRGVREGPGQEGCEEVGCGHCSTHRGGVSGTDAGGRGAVGFVHHHRDQEAYDGIDHPTLDLADRRPSRRVMTGARYQGGCRITRC